MRLRLDQEDMYSEFFADARLLGIVAPVKDYQFCLYLNKTFRLDFRVNNQIEIPMIKKQRNYFFGVYEFCESSCALKHYVYNNQFDGEYLLPEFRHLDFLWLLKGDVVSDELVLDLMSVARNITGVQLVTELAQEKIRHKGNLIF